MDTLSSSNNQSWLSWFLRGLLMFGFLVLISRLIDLQLIRGNYFRDLSEENRIRRVTIQAGRGNILARGGEILVGNKVVFKEVNFDRGEGFTKKAVEGNSVGDNTISEPVRDYKLGSSFGHAGGYVGEVNEDELGKIKGECPEKGARRIGDYIGRTGLEKEYDCTLYGINGEVLFEVDARNSSARILGKKEPVAGNDIKTTIDFGLQQKVAEIMLDRKGAVIVTDPRGEIIAFYSGPSFDPNLFVTETSSRALYDTLNDENLRLFNRATGGLFHPGSVFKPLVAVSALEEGDMDIDYTYQDTGQVVVKNIYGTYSYKNWYFTQYGGVEGEIGIKRALARSTDTFFYKIGELMGADNLTGWAKDFGLSEKTGIDIPGEISGLVPDPGWKLDFKGERWFLGDTYNVSIGQGDLAVTPIALNSAISALTNGGLLCTPHFLQTDDPKCKDLGIDGDNIDVVRLGMEEACATGGTAYPFFDFFERSRVKIACKTGTAQNVNEDPHAWFVAFGPSEKPEIVVTVLAENGGEGSSVAAPIAREIFNYWFKVPVSPTPTPN